MVSPDSRAQRARSQAETPLIVLCRFPGPALFITLAIFVALGALYLFFKRGKNQFLIAVGNMSGKDRAIVLITATVFRMKWERDNPNFSRSIFLDPASFSPEVCNRLFSDLLDLVVLLRQDKHVLDKRLSEFGASEKTPETQINAVRVWMGTIGARCGKIKLEDMVAIWSHLRAGIPFLGEALAELEVEHEVDCKLGNVHEFLEGFPVQQVTREASRIPNPVVLRA
jgi:hypothetical protein